MNDYFAWIANLGVVPLFLFLAFLFDPAAFFLLALLIDVTAVLETMVILLPNHIYHFKIKLFHLRRNKVANIPQCVKIFIPIFLLNTPLSLVNAQNMINLPIKTEVLLPVGHIASYQIKDPQNIETHYDKEKRSLSLRAHSPLETELLLINENGQTIKLFKLHAMAKTFLQTIEQYNRWHKSHLIKKSLSSEIDLLELHPELKKEIWMKLHKIFYQSNYQDLTCQFNGIFLHCLHRYQGHDFLEFQKELKKKFFIQFTRISQNSLGKNYQIKLKLISLENSDGLELHLGLDQLSGSLSDFFNFPLKDIVGKNSVLLNKSQTELSVLGEPIFTSLLNHENTFSIGQDIPFRIKNDNGKSSVQFRFAGLFLKMKLQEAGSLLKVDYQTELTKPEAFGEEVTISGNKQNGAVVIKNGEVLKLFEIEFQTDQKNRSLFPGLSAIPLLGELFTSRSNNASRKKIVGLITVNDQQREGR